MQITILQTDIQWAQPAENMQRAEELINECPGSDLYVLPEMWTTGFATDPAGIPLDGTSALEWMERVAAEHETAVSGSVLMLVDDGTLRNRHYFVQPDGSTGYYDKHHLFTYGHEDRYITPGQEHTVVCYQGVRILLLTCYDLRFPLWSRYGMAGEYDMIVCVANWPESRRLAWHYLTHARAIENQCFLVGANRVGDDVFCHYSGESLVCDSRGETLVMADDRELALTVCLDLDAQEKARKRFRVLDDRDIL